MRIVKILKMFHLSCSSEKSIGGLRAPKAPKRGKDTNEIYSSEVRYIP